MTDEFTDSADADADAGYETDPEEAEGVDPPNLSEAVQQLQATQQELVERMGAEEEDEGSGYGVQVDPAEFDQDELAGLAEASGLLEDDGAENYDAFLDDAIDERVQQAIVPIAGQMEWNRRYEALSGLQDKYNLDEGEIERVAEQAAQFAGAYGNAADSDPAVIERLILADRALKYAAEQEARGPAPEGATLETGAGPSLPQGEPMDPDTKSYMDAIAGSDRPNRFTR